MHEKYVCACIQIYVHTCIQIYIHGIYIIYIHMRELDLGKHFTNAGKKEQLGAPTSSLMTVNYLLTDKT